MMDCGGVCIDNLNLVSKSPSFLHVSQNLSVCLFVYLILGILILSWELSGVAVDLPDLKSIGRHLW